MVLGGWATVRNRTTATPAETVFAESVSVRAEISASLRSAGAAIFRRSPKRGAEIAGNVQSRRFHFFPSFVLQ